MHKCRGTEKSRRKKKMHAAFFEEKKKIDCVSLFFHYVLSIRKSPFLLKEFLEDPQLKGLDT